MTYGICNLSIIPCRHEPSHKSEMVSQLLFGETFQVLEEEENWAKIKTTYDNYESWVHQKQFLQLTIEEYTALVKQPLFMVNELVSVITNKNTLQHFPCLAGSAIYGLEDDYFEIKKTVYNYEGEVILNNLIGSRATVAEKSYEFLNSPYLWGGRSMFGMDCSGFTQLVFKLNGIKLERDAYQQATQGQPLNFLDEVQPGDLAFFDNEEGNITHVGILLNPNAIIHSSGKVRVDKIDHYGIFNQETQGYSHKLRILKRIIEE